MSSKVVSFESLAFTDAQHILDTCPYRCFPVKKNGGLVGVVTREELQESIRSERPPHIEPAVTCYPDQPIKKLANRFIESPSGILVVTEKGDQIVLGILTLHDLLRAQAAVLESQG